MMPPMMQPDTYAQMDVRNVLCIRLDSLGDVLMCTPAMRAIKQSNPGCRLTLLSSGSGAAAVPFIPEIDEAIDYAAPWMKSSRSHDASHDVEFMHRLRGHTFDAAVMFTSYSQSPLPAAHLCYLAGIPIRLAHCRENPYQLLTDWVPDPEPHNLIRHEVRRQLDLVESAGWHTDNEQLSFTVSEMDLVWMRQRLLRAGIDINQPWILLHPGATAASRRYPPGHWAEVVHHLVNELHYDLVLTGSADEVPLIEEIQCSSQAITTSLAGELDLGKLGAAISMTSVLIANNSGPAHMAAALDIPLVDVYALTNPQHTPWHKKSRVLFHDVPCRFCYKSICPRGHHDCLSKIEPAQVIDAVGELMFDRQ
jgi:lipopolysaccharide heptosyltransferase II